MRAACRIGAVYEGHCGPVYSIQRNFFYPKFFVTIGDWTVRRPHFPARDGLPTLGVLVAQPTHPAHPSSSRIQLTHLHLTLVLRRCGC